MCRRLYAGGLDAILAQQPRAQFARGANCPSGDSTRIPDTGARYHNAARYCDVATCHHATDNLRRPGHNIQCIAGLRSRSANYYAGRLVRLAILPTGSRLSPRSPLSYSIDASAYDELPARDHLRSRDRHRHDRRAALHDVLVAVSSSPLHDVSPHLFACEGALVRSRQSCSHGLLSGGRLLRREYDLCPADRNALLHTASDTNNARVAFDVTAEYACR